MGLFVRLGSLIGKSFRVFRLMFPWMIRVIFEGLNVTLVSTIAFFKEIPDRSEKLADKLWNDLFEQRPPFPINEPLVWKFFYYTAYITLIAGWIIASYLTIWFIGAILDSL